MSDLETKVLKFVVENRNNRDFIDSLNDITFRHTTKYELWRARQADIDRAMTSIADEMIKNQPEQPPLPTLEEQL
jgi:hypothetical protein